MKFSKRPIARVQSLVLASMLVGLGLVATSAPAVASGSAPSLTPDPGQYYGITPTRILDTRDGTGGVSVAPLSSDQTVVASVEGNAGIPAVGIAEAEVDVTAINPTATGCLVDYSTDIANPSICNTSFDQGQSITTTDIVQVGADGNFDLKNESAGQVDVTVTVVGYFNYGQPASAGSTFVPQAEASLVDTRTGLGAPQAQVAGGGSLTVQVGGVNRIPPDAADVAVYIGAANATANGFVSAGSSSVGVLQYTSGEIIRNWTIVPLTSGAFTLTNRGSGPTDLTVDTAGYFISPSSTSETGNSYTGVAPSRVLDTRNSSAVPANGSVTFTVEGAGGIPSTDVADVTESVAALSPSATGYLSVYQSGGSDPNEATVNFTSTANQQNDLADPVLATVSTSGQETVANHSSGTVEVVVSVRGYFTPPSAPSPPASVVPTFSSGSATVTWTPPSSDGGSVVTGYVVTNGNGGTYQESPTTTSATFSDSDGDGVQVAAVNVAGTGAPSTSQPNDEVVDSQNTSGPAVGQGTAASQSQLPVTISGDVLTPAGSGLANEYVSVNLAPTVGETDSGSWTPVLIGSAMTDSNGNWSYTISSASSLPAAAVTAEQSNGGVLNIEVTAQASATVSGTIYPEAGAYNDSVDIGGQTTTQPSVAVIQLVPSSTSTTPPNIVGQGDDTVTSQDQINEANYASPVTNSYGYQGSEGNSPSSYDPFVAADGTNLTNVTVTPGDNTGHCQPAMKDLGGPFSSWTTVGEEHAWDNYTGSVTFTTGATSEVDEGFGVTGKFWSVNGAATFSYSSSASITSPTVGSDFSHQFQVSMSYQLTQTSYFWIGPGGDPHCTGSVDGVRPMGMRPMPNGQTTQWGVSVAQWDGVAQKNTYIKNAAIELPGETVGLVTSKSAGWSIAAKVDGFYLGASSSHGTGHGQSVKAGTAPGSTHWIFGHDGATYSTNWPSIIYTN